MRWHKGKYKGEQRAIKMFLWFPETLNNETRWLEMTTVTQEWNGFNWTNKYFKD